MFNDDIRSGWMVSVLPCERKIEGTAVKETYTLINLSPHPHTNIKWPMMQHFILEQSREYESLVFSQFEPPWWPGQFYRDQISNIIKNVVIILQIAWKWKPSDSS